MANKKATALASLSVFGVVVVIAILILIPALTSVEASTMLLIFVGIIEGIMILFLLGLALRALYRYVYEKIDRR